MGQEQAAAGLDLLGSKQTKVRRLGSPQNLMLFVGLVGSLARAAAGIYLEAPLGRVWAGGLDKVPQATLTTCRRLLLWDWQCQEPVLQKSTSLL